MHKYFNLLLLGLTSFSSFAQIKGKLLDSDTKEPIPYVNIWVESENNGATANENGEFTLENITGDETILFSAVGYGETKIKANDIKQVIYLEPKAIELDGVTIVPRKNKLKRIVNRMDEIDITHFASTCSSRNPMMQARFIPHKEGYTQTPFISEINFLTHSHTRNAIFYVRLYTVGEDGKPGELLHDEPIIGKAVNKKMSITTIDVSKLNIQVPEKGFFVAIEWLIIKRNEFEMFMTGSKKGTINYTPTFRNVYTKNDVGGWIYERGEWKKDGGKFDKKFHTFAVELVLTD